MPNVFASAPELAAEFPQSVKLWTCPLTGMQVPKNPDANLQWRAQILTAAENDEDLQCDLYTACSQSLLFFVNAFAYTLRVFEATDGKPTQAKNAHIPYVTWEVQDRHLLWLQHKVEVGEEGLTDKSRDMGATWDHIVVETWFFLFRPDVSGLMISRKEDAVDNLDGRPTNYPYGMLADPGTLFGKVDYILSRLPEWMLPKMSRKKLHLINLENRSRIDGESANATAGSSDRRTYIFLDEMAKMAEGEAIKRSTKDVTACRLVCSTPNGAGTAYSKWRLSGQIDVFVLPWWEHPEKGRGRYVTQDATGKWKIRSPWYDHECDVRSPKEVAIELDMDHIGSGDTFFEPHIIEEHRRLFAIDPKRRLDIDFRKEVPDTAIPEILIKRDTTKVRVQPAAKTGRWRLWANLIDGRLDQTKTYTIGCDIGKGQGASNSTASVVCNETREKIMEFADANTPPYEFARLVVAACTWIGGRSRPYLVWENNGDPGFDFGRQIVHVYSYPNVYFDKIAGTVNEMAGKRYGWRSSPEAKAARLGVLRRAYAHGGFINHSHEALTEALQYISYEGGGIGPANLVEESESVRKAHGDRVIADVCCLIGLGDKPVNNPERRPPPQWTPAHRMAEAKRRKKEAREKKRFDFRGVQ